VSLLPDELVSHVLHKCHVMPRHAGTHFTSCCSALCSCFSTPSFASLARDAHSSQEPQDDLPFVAVLPFLPNSCPPRHPAVNYNKRHVVEFYTRLGATLPEIVHPNKSVECELLCPEVNYKTLHVPALKFQGEGMFMKVRPPYRCRMLRSHKKQSTRCTSRC
jgi:hypothetical protein